MMKKKSSIKAHNVVKKVFDLNLSLSGNLEEHFSKYGKIENYRFEAKTLFFQFYLGYHDPGSFLSCLPQDIFRPIVCTQFNYWAHCTPNTIELLDKDNYARKKIGGVKWNCAAISSEPNQEIYTVQLDLPDMKKVDVSSCIMIGLSKFDEVDYIGTKNFSYKRGYYLMIWKDKMTRFSKEIEDGEITNAPEVRGDSFISIKYSKERKEVEFYLDGNLLESPFIGVDWGVSDYYLVGLFCCEKDGIRIVK